VGVCVEDGQLGFFCYFLLVLPLVLLRAVSTLSPCDKGEKPPKPEIATLLISRESFNTAATGHKGVSRAILSPVLERPKLTCHRPRGVGRLLKGPASEWRVRATEPPRIPFNKPITLTLPFFSKRSVLGRASHAITDPIISGKQARKCVFQVRTLKAANRRHPKEKEKLVDYLNPPVAKARLAPAAHINWWDKDCAILQHPLNRPISVGSNTAQAVKTSYGSVEDPLI
jgi:hypothetical protein